MLSEQEPLGILLKKKYAVISVSGYVDAVNNPVCISESLKI